MDATATRPLPKHDPARWELIMAWSGLSKEAACAWWKLWDIAVKQGAYTVLVHPVAIGEALGAGDRQRTGKRALDALNAKDLIFVKDRGTVERGRERGLWLIVLEDPWEVHKRRIVRAAAEIQGELYEEEKPVEKQETQSVPLRSEQAVVVQPPPSARSEVEVVRSAQIERSEVPNYLANGGDGTTTACSVVKPSSQESMPTVKDALVESMNRLTERVQLSREHQPAEVQKIADRIFLMVDDPNLFRSKCEQIGWAIVENLYPRSKLEAILARLKRDHAHRSPKQRGEYFHGAMRQSFKECGLDYNQVKREKAVAGEIKDKEEVPY